MKEHIDIYIRPQKLTPEDTLTDGGNRQVEITGNTLLVWVDLMPSAKFAHPTLYVLISAKGTRVEKGEWWPVLNGEKILYGSTETVKSPVKLPTGRA
jgi:hypothetical protein